MSHCSICKKAFSAILMNNRWVCFKCDELLFDIEIESDEAEVDRPKTHRLAFEPTTVQKTSGQK